MKHKLEVFFVQGTGAVSKVISNVSKKLHKGSFKSDFAPSHVLLVLDETIVFESSTYTKAGDDQEKTVEKGTRLLTLEDIDDRNTEAVVKRCTVSNNVDPYLALKYVAKASNYHYSYSSVLKFACSGHLRKSKKKKKQPDEYICSGLVLDALREPAFNKNTSVRKVTDRFKDIDSNSVTPLDLYVAFNEAGFKFKTQIGY